MAIPFQSSTLLIENYRLKYDLIKRDRIVKNKSPVTSKALFLTLTLITLNFKCYRKDWEENNSKKKCNPYNTKRNSNSGKLTPFMILSWEQQKHLFTSSSSWARYHAVIIRFCSSVYPLFICFRMCFLTYVFLENRQDSWKAHPNEFILSKSAVWEPATLSKNELLNGYFSRVCSNQKLTLFKLWKLKNSCF